ncbi:tRNA (adenine(58)-N(1))-methyltransferase, mitochondrial [Esox lucius]|uniref:tRNA (adenine(58)-N(1))-methyltransferase, mitochondrial n=1 Tax=Esox lucius TaxID=8010 RepID=UPI0005770E0A|nr:tRNA (adenine(58)-N(1))-methyltransferase, mitochondrial [Esox lucius]
MSVGLQFGGSLLTHRLLQICVNRIGQQRYRKLHLTSKFPTHRPYTRHFGTSPKDKGENGSESTTTPDPMQTMGKRESLFGKRRPLSPLERISRLFPQDSLAPEVLQLRDEENPKVEQREPEGVENDNRSSAAPVMEIECPNSECEVQSSELEAHIIQDTIIDNIVLEQTGGAFLMDISGQEKDCVALKPLLPGERSLMFGELLLAEYRRKGRVEFRKMFQLQEGQRLQSSWGTIGHSDIAGCQAGDILQTIHGTPILIRRPNLEEYVLFMKRGPAIAYPKDASMMLMLMDVTEGDSVLEAGSGSGAMSLFLSRAVGSKGRVMSVEIREDHHRRAVLNYNRWRSSWSLRRGEEWPDNVCFYNADLQGATSLLAGQGFHSIALDMIHPHLALPTVTPHLHPGAVCAIYLANITQVIDLLEGLRCAALPLLCERIIEVPLRDWLLAAAVQKDGQFCRRKAPPSARSQEEDEEKESIISPVPAAFGSVPYIARPHPEQVSHTAFLVKLRKYQRQPFSHHENNNHKESN